jgi:hypothetical protein
VAGAAGATVGADVAGGALEPHAASIAPAVTLKPTTSRLRRDSLWFNLITSLP